MENAQNENTAVAVNGISISSIRAELDRILRSRVFIHSHRIRRFLQFVVEESLLGQHHRLKEYLIGLEVFNRVESFDPRVDSIVRVEARRLRSKLDEYYQLEGRDDEVRIELRKGSYIPLFEHRRIGKNGFGTASSLRRNLVAIGRFSYPAGESPEVVEDIQRRLTHILINEGYCQVVAPESGEEAENARPDFVLEGTLEQRDGKTHVLLQLHGVAEGAYIWSESATVEEVELAARSLNRMLLTSYARAEGGRIQRHNGHRQSFDYYLHGRYSWKLGTPESIRGSANFFQKAIECDSGYAAAWGALAEALMVSSLFGFLNPREFGAKMKEAARKAVSLNEGLPEAHVALGSVLSLVDWNWEAGERELQRAIQIDGRDPSVHVAYSLQLACRGMLDTAMLETERALELDPASLATNFVLGWLHCVSRRYDEAISQHSVIAQLAPDFALAYLGLGWAYLGKGLPAEAVAHFTNATNLLKSRPLLSGCLGHCYAKMGQRDEALRHLARLSSQPPSQYVSPVNYAAIYAGLGEDDRAFAYLEQALEIRDSSLPLQLLNPEFDSLVSAPRFGEFLSRMGLSHYRAAAADRAL